MPVVEQVIAQNMKTQVVVISSDAKGTEYVEWQAAGDPGGADVQIVPEVIARSAQFTKLIHKGIVEIITADDSFMQAMEKQKAAFEARLNGAAARAQESIIKEADNDLLSLPCVGPDSRGSGNCGTLVPVREKTKHDKPALCPTHENLIGQFILTEEQKGTEITKKWSRVSLTAPEKQSA